MNSLPTGTVAFVFTAIEGPTALLQRLGNRWYAEVLGEHAAGHSYRDVAGHYAVSKTALHRYRQAQVMAEPTAASAAAALPSGTAGRSSAKWLWRAAGIPAGVWLLSRAALPSEA